MSIEFFFTKPFIKKAEKRVRNAHAQIRVTGLVISSREQQAPCPSAVKKAKKFVLSCFLDDKGSRSVLVPHDDLPDKNAGHNQEAQNSHYYGFLYAWLFHLDIPYEQKGHQKHNDSVYRFMLGI